MTVNLLEQNHLYLLNKIEKESFAYSVNSSISRKKKLGQFFTDSSVANYMSTLFSFKKSIDKKLKVLDCGAGHGVLAIALLYKLVTKGYKTIELTLYEIDNEALKYLDDNLKLFKENHDSINFSYTIIQKNFILDNGSNKFDYIISNPPYFKLNKSDLEAKSMSYIVHGQPNIYMLFMAKSGELLTDKGEMVFITPRSFTSGTYFKKFREYLLDKLSLEHIHIFNSRKKHFKNETILQETIITKFIKEPSDNITITSSEDSKFLVLNSLKVKREMIIERGRNIIGIPSSKEDIEVLKLFSASQQTFRDMGYKISTGKVVTFRSREYIHIDKYNLFSSNQKSVPLLWMQNFKKEKLIFPLDSKKEQYIQNLDKTKSLLIKNENYIIVKRFSSKEQHRRINIGYIFKDKLPYDYLGLENHLNYIYREERQLKKDEMKLLGSFLTSKEVDQYFRIFNGNTQVNATDILNLPIPAELFKGYKCQE
ncbi:Modification methylase PstI [hydrothermal vent metagenome]|uniref:site-specific DNA-methyltransferase (adenine-specific) n=1 Tax=hydrothermal vent metagenome TaxID=652676 RepID=A0A1W1BY51_9ZZZZ